MSTNSELSTSCQHCVFATFDRDYQTGCKAGFLEKYMNAESNKNLDKVKFVTENGKAFYKIIDRICVGCRLVESPWDKKYAGLDKLDILKEEIAFRYDVIVFVTDETTLEDLKLTTESIIKSSLKPIKVIYVYANTIIKYGELLKYVNAAYVGTNIGWQIKEMENKLVTLEECIGACIVDTKSEYSVTTIAGLHFSSEFGQRLAIELREKMSQFIMILPDELDNYFVISKKAFIAAGGLSPIEVEDDGKKQNIESFIDKIIVLTKAQGKQHFIWTPNFQPLQ